MRGRYLCLFVLSSKKYPRPEIIMHLYSRSLMTIVKAIRQRLRRVHLQHGDFKATGWLVKTMCEC
jgi:hypothetical protein